MEKTINKWLEKGLIDKETALRLINEAKEEAEGLQKIHSLIALYVVGAVLLGLGVISFIAANDWILEFLKSSDFLKILLLSGTTIGSFYGGYKLAYENKNYPRLGRTLIFLSTILIGATYALVGQIYHLNANNSFLMFLWTASILPLAYIFKDKAINILSIILFIFGVIFYYMELSFDKGYTWTIFIPVILGTFLYSLGNIPSIQKNYNNFSLSYKLVGLAPIFTTLIILICSFKDSYELLSLNYILPIMFLFALNFAIVYLKEDKDLLFNLEEGFIFALLTLLVLILTLPVISIPLIMLTSHLLIIFVISTGFYFGYKFENVGLINSCTWFLIIYLTTTYCRFGWNFMDKTLFFILGGACLLGLGSFLERKKKETLKGSKWTWK